MVRYESLINRTGLTRQAIQYRAKKIGIKAETAKLHGKLVFGYSEEDAERIVNYVPEKTGRKRRS